MTNHKKSDQSSRLNQKVSSVLPNISAKDIQEFSALIKNERSFYQRMGLQFISDMLV
jgi:hypothetical protein